MSRVPFIPRCCHATPQPGGQPPARSRINRRGLARRTVISPVRSVAERSLPGHRPTEAAEASHRRRRLSPGDCAITVDSACLAQERIPTSLAKHVARAINTPGLSTMRLDNADSATPFSPVPPIMLPTQRCHHRSIGEENKVNAPRRDDSQVVFTA